MFTQSQYILLANPLSLDQISPAFGNFTVLGRTAGNALAHWAHGKEFWTLTVPHEERCRLIVDVVPHPWPDQYDPPAEKAVFAAWRMGQFGPNVRAGSFGRALAEYSRDSNACEPASHSAFIRLRIAYAPVDDAPPIPETRDPLAELVFMTRVSYFCLELEGALVYFDPNGEVIKSARSVWESVDYYSALGTVPWRLWASIYATESGWRTNGLERLGWPEVRMDDAPSNAAGKDVLKAYLDQAAEQGVLPRDQWIYRGQPWFAKQARAGSREMIVLCNEVKP